METHHIDYVVDYWSWIVMSVVLGMEHTEIYKLNLSAFHVKVASYYCIAKRDKRKVKL